MGSARKVWKNDGQFVPRKRTLSVELEAGFDISNLERHCSSVDNHSLERARDSVTSWHRCVAVRRYWRPGRRAGGRYGRAGSTRDDRLRPGDDRLRDGGRRDCRRDYTRRHRGCHRYLASNRRRTFVVELSLLRECCSDEAENTAQHSHRPPATMTIPAHSALARFDLGGFSSGEGGAEP